MQKNLTRIGWISSIESKKSDSGGKDSSLSEDDCCASGNSERYVVAVLFQTTALQLLAFAGEFPQVIFFAGLINICDITEKHAR